jgi:hypothetical protein
MPTRKRVAPWRTLAVAQGNAIQGGGVLGAAALAWYAGRKGARAAYDIQSDILSFSDTVTSSLY